MIRNSRGLVALAVPAALALAMACYDDNGYAPQPYTPESPAVLAASGNVAARVDEFRALLGEPSNGGTAGEQPAGRREIGWDGAAANPFNNKNDFPAAFFNTTSKSGVIFTTPGTGFRNDSLRFVEVNAGYANEFGTFSPTKIFSPIGSNVMDVVFQVAGQPTPAEVTGFGVLFSDVEVAGATTIELFDRAGQSLGKIEAPVRSDAAGLSFVGARFTQAIIARARITLGTGALGATINDISAGGTLDLVVTDNFIYGEPRAIK